MTFGARALIRLGALEHNFERIRAAANGANIIAVVKANAYGHGLTTIALSLPLADCFAVARLSEADALADAGVEKPILLLQGVIDAEERDQALRRGFQLVVYSEWQIRLLEQAQFGSTIVWLKLDSGMHRLGFDPSSAGELVARLNRCRAVDEVRLMTHLANADDREDKTTERQVEVFRELSKGFDGHISIANSPGLLGWPDTVTAGHPVSKSWVRAGICLYGVSPFPGTCGAEIGLQPVMEFSCRLIDVRPVQAAEPIGYGGTWHAPAEGTVLGVISAGYGDGYSRFLGSGTPVLVDGRRVYVAGRISMDMATVDLGRGATDEIGAGVTLWGEDLPVEEVAAHAGTVPYQLLAGVTNRERRVILDRTGCIRP
ncbi:MAG: alanine racemase [Woeseia sp.]